MYIIEHEARQKLTRRTTMTTMVTYSNISNPFDLVLIKSDDSFVIVGDSVPSDYELQKMIDWEDVQGWTLE